MPRTAHAHTAYDQGLKLSSAGRHLEAINQYEQALAQDPHDPRILFALGNTAGALGMRGPAEQFFRQVLAIDPARLEATVNLANLLRENGQFDAAIALLEPALARSPQSPELNLTLGSAWRESGDNSRAEPYYLAALDVRPDYAPALSNLADLRCDQGAWDEARALYDRAIRGDPKNPQIRLNRAIMNLLCGALKDGWRDYDARIAIAGKVPAANLNLAPWTGETLRGKRLLVRAEQGVGDQILFASTIPDLCARATHDGGSVVLECEPRLADLFARSFPGARVYPARISSAGADYTWLKSAGGVNAAVPMGSLPRYLRGAPERFPSQHAYLMPDALEAARWRQLMGGGAKTIGICWRSGKSGGHRSLQYAPLEEWGAFLRRLPAGVIIVSVQYDAAPEEIAALEQLAERRIAVPGGIDQKNELDRAAALLSALDAVVSAPTAVAWLAAATGTATWKVLYDTSWTALGQSYEPFAPACKLAMPQTRGDWPSAFAEVIRALY